MTSPDGGKLRADLDQLDATSNIWQMNVGDLHPGPFPSPGEDLTDPTVLATAAIHGTVQLTSAQLMALLSDYAGKTGSTSQAFRQQEGMNASSMKDIMNMLTSSAKDGGAIATDVFKNTEQMVTTAGTAATQAGTTAMNAAMTAASTAPKINAPGGAVAQGLTNPANIQHANATTSSDRRDDDGRSDVDPATGVQRRSTS